MQRLHRVPGRGGAECQLKASKSLYTFSLSLQMPWLSRKALVLRSCVVGGGVWNSIRTPDATQDRALASVATSAPGIAANLSICLNQRSLHFSTDGVGSDGRPPPTAVVGGGKRGSGVGSGHSAPKWNFDKHDGTGPGRMPNPLEVGVDGRRADWVGPAGVDPAACGGSDVGDGDCPGDGCASDGVGDPAGVAPAALEDGNVDREGFPWDDWASDGVSDPAGVTLAALEGGDVERGGCPCPVTLPWGSDLPPLAGRCRIGGARMKLVLVRRSVLVSTLTAVMAGIKGGLEGNKGLLMLHNPPTPIASTPVRDRATVTSTLP